MQVFNYGGIAANAIDNFGQGLNQMRERQSQEQMVQQQKDALNQAAQLYSTGTPDEIAQFSIQNPQAGELLSRQLAFKSDATRQNMMDSMQQILLDPSQTESVLTNRIKMIQEQGGDPSQTMSELEQFRTNPEGYEQKVERAYAMMDPQGYGAYRSSMPQQQAPNYSNVQFDEAGNPYGLNKTTGKYEPIKGGFQRAKPTPQTVVNMGAQGLTEEQKALAKQRVNRYGKITDDADSASQEIDSINQIRAIDLDTGFGTEVKSTAAKVINALGGNGESLLNVDISDVEKFNAVAEKQVLNVMSSQKGPQTDQDAARIKKTVAGTENTKEANAFILDSMEAIANRKIEQQAFWDSYLESNDGSLKGVQLAWNKYKKETPMVSEVVKNPSTGKPMFFYQFRAAFPDRDESEVIQAWRKLTGGK